MYYLTLKDQYQIQDRVIILSATLLHNREMLIKVLLMIRISKLFHIPSQRNTLMLISKIKYLPIRRQVNK